MERKELAYLAKWRTSDTRKPLVIQGARQVGKTWLMKEFGRLHYEQFAYINFESNAALKSLFEIDYNIERILTAIKIETGVSIEDPENTLIILDEIQEAKGGLTSLKYFFENAPQFHILAAGSLLGIAMENKTSFPVGKVDILDLYPFSFTEFLQAMGQQDLLQLLHKKDWDLVATFRNKYIELLKQYYFVGGMPEAVRSFSRKKDFNEVRTILKNILTSYEQDFSKHAPSEIVPRIRMVWNSIPSQLARENRKFIYSALRSGARAKDYEMALNWLKDAGLIYMVHNVTSAGLPLKGYQDLSAFKLFMLDTGLLSAMTELDAKTLIGGNEIFTQFKGALTEQYVLQQLVSLRTGAVYYWSAENARAEIDFLVQHDGIIIPIEVKAEENLRSKSLRVFYEKFNPQQSVRFSMSDHREQDWMVNVPLYAVETVTG